MPDNDWEIRLEPGQCIDIIPIGDTQYCVRCYHINDKFAGAAQQEKRFPVVESLEKLVESVNMEGLEGLGQYATTFLSAEDISRTEDGSYLQGDLKEAFLQIRSGFYPVEAFVRTGDRA